MSVVILMCSISNETVTEVSSINRIRQFHIVEYCGLYLGAN